MIINPYIFLINSGNPLWNGLQAYYTADSTPNDALDNYNGTLVNGTTYGTGIINQGFSLDGANDYINISPTLGQAVSGAGNPHTYSVWIYPTNVTDSYNVIFTNIYASAGGTALLLNTNKIGFWTKGFNGTLYTSTTTITANNWYHILTSIDSSGNLNIYINGVLDRLVTGVTWTENVLTYDRNHIGTYATNYFDGVIDEVGVWNRALDSTEVTELYNGGSALQYS